MIGAKPKTTSRRIDGKLPTPIYKKSKIDLAANETRVDFGDWAVVLHARNDGVAWRFETAFGGEITIPGESTGVCFPKGTELCYTQEMDFMSGWEKPAKIGPVESVPNQGGSGRKKKKAFVQKKFTFFCGRTFCEKRLIYMIPKTELQFYFL